MWTLFGSPARNRTWDRGVRTHCLDRLATGLVRIIVDFFGFVKVASKVDTTDATQSPPSDLRSLTQAATLSHRNYAKVSTIGVIVFLAIDNIMNAIVPCIDHVSPERLAHGSIFGETPMRVIRTMTSSIRVFALSFFFAVTIALAAAT